jgi:outer membrane protein OmpA-like peptidoglycan-associated protein
MLLRRSLPRAASALSCAAALGLGSSALLAQPAPGAAPAPAPAPAQAPADEPIRFTLDLHGGLIYRVGPVDPAPTARGGGLVGLDALIGTNRWYQVGLGYDHGFIGRERNDSGAGRFFDTNRTLDVLWALGRVFPWQNDEVALWVQLGLGPAWQTISAAGETSVTGPDGQVALVASSCSGRSPPGLGLRGGVGVDVALGSLIIFTADVGADHYRLTSQSINNCGPGMGAATFLATRFGFALATGRSKPPAPPAPPPVLSDRDGDAIIDNVDACPDQPGLPSTDPTKNGCPPPPDRDHDGIPDASDACPDAAGPPSDDPKKNGCPDRDGDKIIDALDACPDVPGRPSDDPKENGCPPDTDGDGIRDDKDACPKEKGLPNEDPTKNGCPLVVVREKEIVISQQVQFEVDRSIIRPESKELLDTVAQALKDHPEIVKLEVQGHTDNSGNERHNKILSAARAESVRRALIQRGIAERRLLAQGYGQEQPLAANDTDVNMAKNRRVQFLIFEKKAPGDDAAPKSPPHRKK